MNQSVNQILIIFGASGDLTKRKLMPALFDLFKQKLLPEKFIVLGASRTKLSDGEFRKNSVEFISGGKEINDFKKFLFYESIMPGDIASFKNLKNRIYNLSEKFDADANCIFYLSTPPSVYGTIAKNISLAGLSRSDKYFRRLIVEKPFGTDLESAQKLNRDLLNYFDENQIYRIDHYLGKESVQNMLVTRFGNGIFEPIWNRNFIDHVEITAAESLGVEGRGGYYDNSGALRDMVQNHLLQLVGFASMEPPAVNEADAIRNEILKVFKSLRPVSEQEVSKNVVRGQYVESVINGNKISGYREEEGVDPASRTETFVAMKFFIDNWRWAGIPFYIRTGKKLPAKVTEIVIHFKHVPHHLFNNSDYTAPSHNQLIIRIQPDEGILLKFRMKTPGAGFQTQTVNMDFHYSDLADVRLPSAYERLLLDCMNGDPTLYSRGDAVEEAWKFVQPVINAWNNNQDIPVYGYPAGTWGPEEAEMLVDGGEWRYPCKNLSSDGTFCEL
ncbi:MAG: glucose-6-phosphate dehydrogenase [Prolixibacteraceae bacterium]|nr:glucose-6-phosphate dehydrogenase [Prolixibacteraceae bacterium]